MTCTRCLVANLTTQLIASVAGKACHAGHHLFNSRDKISSFTVSHCTVSLVPDRLKKKSVSIPKRNVHARMYAPGLPRRPPAHRQPRVKPYPILATRIRGIFRAGLEEKNHQEKKGAATAPSAKSCRQLAARHPSVQHVVSSPTDSDFNTDDDGEHGAEGGPRPHLHDPHVHAAS